MSILQELESAIGSVAQKVGSSVVGVGGRRAVGSGVIVAPGRVLTNAHNVGREGVSVTFADGRSVQATVRGIDLEGDIAVLDVDTGDAPPLVWNGASPGIGAPIFALSNPGGGGLRVTFGLVSGTQRAFRGPRGRRITGSLEHTAPLLPGSSGGPVVDASGAFLGLNTNRLGEGFYLAIPADPSLRERVDALDRGESPERPRLGIAIAPPHVARGLRRAVGLPEADGVLIRHVEADSPAAKAGLREGDLIVQAAGKPITDVDGLHDAVDALGAGPVELKVLRGAEELAITVSR